MKKFTKNTKKNTSRENIEIYKKIIENCNEAILLTRPDGSIDYANPAACQMFGRTLKNMCKTRREDIVDITDPRFHAALEQRKKTGKFKKEFNLVKKDGTIFPAEVSSMNFIDENGIERSSIIFRDLTIQRNLEETGKTHELTISSIFRSAPIGIGVEVDRVMKEVNDEFCNMFGYSREELVGKDSQMLYPEKKDYEKMGKEKYDLIKYGKIGHKETKMKRKDGKIIDVLITVAYRNFKDPAQGVTFTVLDITKQRETEKQLSESEFRFKDLFENSGTSILIIDKDGIYRLVNDKTAKAYGKPKEQIEGKSMFDFLPYETAKRYLEFNRAFIEKGGQREYEDNFFINKKSRFYYIVDRVLKDSDGNNYAILCSAVDITEQKLAEEKTELLAHTTTSIKEIITVTDLEDNFTYVNKSFCDIYGYTYEEILGQNVKILVSPNNPPELIGNVLMQSHKDGWNGEILNLTKDGKEFPIYLHTSKVLNKNGEVIGLAGISEDITKRKQVERELKKSEEKYHTIFEATGTATLLINEDTTISMANRECEKITGYTKEELIGTKWTNYVDPSSLQGMLKNHNIRRLEPGSAPKNYEVKLINKKGEVKDSILDIGMIPGTKQSIVSILDITARKQAELALKISEQRLAEAQSRSQMGSWEYNISTQLNYWSDEMFKLFNIDKESGVPLFEEFIYLIHPDDRERIKISFTKAIKDRAHHKESFRIKNSDGTIKWLEAQGEPVFDKENKLIKMAGTTRDITNSVYYEENLEKEQQQYAALIKNLPGFVYRCKNDRDWTMLYISEGFRKITGYAPEEIIGNKKLSFNDIILPEYRKYLWDKWQKLLKEKTTFEDEYRIYTADGKIKWIWERGNGIFNEKGEILYLEGYIEDITEHKKAEEEIQKSELHFRTLFMSLSEGFYISEVINDEKGNPCDYKYLEVNNEFEKILGLKREEIIGKRYTELVPSDSSTWLNNYCEVAKTGNPKLYEFYSKEYEKHFETYSYRPVKNQVCVFVRDITQRKQTEEALKESERKYRNLIETMPEGFYRSTAEGYFLDVNPALVKMLGYESKEDLMKVYIPEDLYFTKEERIVEEDYNIDFIPDTEVYRLKKKDKSEIWIEDHSRYMQDETGKILYHEGIMRDITESLKAQKAIIEAKEKAEEANRLKSSFLANMSHEIRTPLNGILGFSQILKNELKDSSLARFADIIEKSGNRLLETLDLILSFSKLEAEKEDVHYSNTKLEDVIDEVLKSFEAMANSKNLFLKSNYKTENLVTKIDERFLRQILNNLINNAIKYTNSGGIEVELQRIDNEVQLKVIDTGIGIAKDKYDIIFDEFRQESEGHGRSFEGTGLGLAITKRFVELMKGSIEVESELGVGSTFIVKFPYEKGKHSITIKLKDEKPVNKEYPLPHDETKLNVLIVENDDMNLDYTISLLKNYYNPESALDGPGAIEKSKLKKFDIILMDINLGKGMDGIKTAQEIRKLPGYEKTPIVALTAFVLPGDREEFLAGGCTHYLGKPFTRNQILELLKKISDNI